MARKQLTLGGGLRSVALALLLLHFGLHSVSGLHCYECTSDDPGCDENVVSSPVSYVQECGPKSIGCVVHAFNYEYLFDTIFHRDCFYSYDPSTFNSFSKGDGFEYFEIWRPGSYDFLMGHWSGRRWDIFNAKGPVMINRPAPSMPAKWILQVWYQEKHGDLSNGVDFSKYTWPGYKEKSPERIKSLECFSCEFELEGRYIIELHKDSSMYTKEATLERNLPPCTSQSASPLKKVTCENAYGCATLMEIKNFAAQKREGRTKPFVSKVWRGCWYPGDYKCLRNPDPGRSGQERSFRSDSYDDQGSEKCTKAYQRSFNSTNGVVVWAGQVKIESSTEYNKYLQCRHQVRLGAKAETKLELVDDTVEEDYAYVQYQFCGPRSKCNRFVNVSVHLPGNDKYNVKDYEAIGEVEEDESKKKCTNLGDCCEEEEDKGFKNGGGVISTEISYLFGSLLLLLF